MSKLTKKQSEVVNRIKARKGKQATEVVTAVLHRDPVAPPPPNDGGNALVAFRVPTSIVTAYVKKHGSRVNAWAALRKHMEAVTK